MRILKYVISLAVSALVSYGLVRWLAYPTLMNYPKLANAMGRFEYTEIVLLLFLTLSIWLFLVQLELRKVSVIYLYLVYSVYLFFLFVILFAKTPNQHGVSLDLFDFVVKDRRILTEALLNVIYFIPLGGLYGIKANFLEFTTVSLLTILGIETLQYVFQVGTFALSDILLNWIGCLIGYLACNYLKRRMKVI